MNCNGDCLRCTLDLSLCPLELEPEDDFSMLTAEDYRAEEVKAALDTRTPRQKAIAAKKREYYEANRDAIAAKQKKIKDARLAHGYTQDALGRLLGVTKSAIYHWEKGDGPAPWDKLIPVLPELAEVAP